MTSILLLSAVCSTIVPTNDGPNRLSRFLDVFDESRITIVGSSPQIRCLEDDGKRICLTPDGITDDIYFAFFDDTRGPGIDHLEFYTEAPVNLSGFQLFTGEDRHDLRTGLTGFRMYGRIDNGDPYILLYSTDEPESLFRETHGHRTITIYDNIETTDNLQFFRLEFDRGRRTHRNGPVIYDIDGIGIPAVDPGDINRDGIVNAADLNILGLNWHQENPEFWWDSGDLNGDDIVNSRDLNIVAKNWSVIPPLLAVPEPSEYNVYFLIAIFAIILVKLSHSNNE